MFKLAASLAASLFFSNLVAGVALVPRKDPPPGWNTDLLEPYDCYHLRYLAIGCEYQHGKPFFDQCCHPLLANQTLANDRPSWCAPTQAQLSSASIEVAEETSTASSDDPDCTDEPDVVTVTSTSVDAGPTDNGSNNAAPDVQVAPTQTPTQTPAPPAPTDDGNNNNNDGSGDNNNNGSGGNNNNGSGDNNNNGSGDNNNNGSGDNNDNGSGDNNNGGGSQNSGGVATFFYQGGQAGACGDVHSDNDFICAIDADRYGDLGAVSPLCGQSVLITNVENGQTITVVIADACPTCDNSNSIDLSVGAFSALSNGNLDEGEFPIVWTLL